MPKNNYEDLKERTYKANIALVEAGLVILTWGNASAADRAQNVFAIKPSGVPYAKLKPSDMVVLEISTGKTIEGAARPSSDTPTHLHLYQQFQSIGGIVHTHSTCGTSFAQAQREIPCLGTTHADNFYGPIPVTRPMHDNEIKSDYELNTGKIIVETFKNKNLNAADINGVLVANHAPFAWGATIEKAVENAIVLEFSAKMALYSLSLNPNAPSLSQAILDKHFLRKHGSGAYYGQPDTKH